MRWLFLCRIKNESSQRIEQVNRKEGENGVLISLRFEVETKNVHVCCRENKKKKAGRLSNEILKM